MRPIWGQRWTAKGAWLDGDDDASCGACRAARAQGLPICDAHALLMVELL